MPRGKGYHSWTGSTPIVDVVIQVLWVVFTVIGGYALLFAVLALRDWNIGLAAQYGAFLVAGGVTMAGAYAFREWRRHNG